MLRVLSLMSVSNCIIKLCCIFVSYDWLQILKISFVFLFFKSRTVTLSDVSSSASLNQTLGFSSFCCLTVTVCIIVLLFVYFFHHAFLHTQTVSLPALSLVNYTSA